MWLLSRIVASAPVFRLHAKTPKRVHIEQTGVTIHETHLSTQQAPESPEPRFFKADVDQTGSKDYQSPARKGKKAPGRVTRTGRPREPVKRVQDLSRKTFTKADRLRKRPEFIRLIREGRRVHTSFFTASFAPAPGRRHRLGVTVTKRVGKAVHRNRVKRLAREYFRQNRDRIHGRWDINVVAKYGAAELQTSDVFRQLQTLLERISRSKTH
jgi:ribonuclease P protein component